MNAKDKEQYVKENFDLWKEKYEFPEHLDFEIQTLFELQYNFSNLPSDHVRNKRELLDMILRIKSHLPSSFFSEKE